jgi:hypothetical protein
MTKLIPYSRHKTVYDLLWATLLLFSYPNIFIINSSNSLWQNSRYQSCIHRWLAILRLIPDQILIFCFKFRFAHSRDTFFTSARYLLTKGYISHIFIPMVHPVKVDLLHFLSWRCLWKIRQCQAILPRRTLEFPAYKLIGF